MNYEPLEILELNLTLQHLRDVADTTDYDSAKRLLKTFAKIEMWDFKLDNRTIQAIAFIAKSIDWDKVDNAFEIVDCI